MERTRGPEDRPERGGGSSGRWRGDEKWAETGGPLPHTRVVRAASCQPCGAGGSPSRRSAGTEVVGPRCARFFRFWRGLGVRGYYSRPLQGEWKMWRDALRLVVFYSPAVQSLWGGGCLRKSVSRAVGIDEGAATQKVE